MGRSQRPSEGNKKVYVTLAQAIKAKSGVQGRLVPNEDQQE